MKYKVKDIVWDTEDSDREYPDTEPAVALPTTVIVEIADEDDEETAKDAAMDAASDAIGYCISSCDVEPYQDAQNWHKVFHEEVLPQLRGATEILIVGPSNKAESVVYELLNNHPQVNVRGEPESGKSLLEQQHALEELRRQIPGGETLVVKTNSPVIVSTARRSARIIVVDNGPDNSVELSPYVYTRSQLDRHMFNTLMTSEIFRLESARVTPNVEEYTTADSYALDRINQVVERRLREQRAAGKKFLSDEDIDEIINNALDEEKDKHTSTGSFEYEQVQADVYSVLDKCREMDKDGWEVIAMCSYPQKPGTLSLLCKRIKRS